MPQFYTRQRGRTRKISCTPEFLPPPPKKKELKYGPGLDLGFIYMYRLLAPDSSGYVPGHTNVFQVLVVAARRVKESHSTRTYH